MIDLKHGVVFRDGDGIFRDRMKHVDFRGLGMAFGELFEERGGEGGSSRSSRMATTGAATVAGGGGLSSSSNNNNNCSSDLDRELMDAAASCTDLDLTEANAIGVVIFTIHVYIYI